MQKDHGKCLWHSCQKFKVQLCSKSPWCLHGVCLFTHGLMVVHNIMWLRLNPDHLDQGGEAADVLQGSDISLTGRNPIEAKQTTSTLYWGGYQQSGTESSKCLEQLKPLNLAYKLFDE